MEGGMAENWAANYVDNVYDMQVTGQPLNWGTWLEFEAQIVYAFADPNKSKTAQAKL